MPDRPADHLVLLPGWGFNGKVLSGLAGVLAEKYHRKVTILDLPGYGGCKVGAGPSGLDAFIEPLLPFMNAHTALVGWSLGGMAAIRMAVKLPDRISTVVLLASTPCFVKKRDWPHGIDHWQLHRMSRRLQSRTGTQKVLRDFSTIVAMGDRSPKITAARLQTMLSVNETDNQGLRQGLALLGNSDLRADMTRLACRIVMLLAENDRLIANSTGAATREFCPSLILDCIPQSGHAPFISEPEKTAALLNKHLDHQEHCEQTG